MLKVNVVSKGKYKYPQSDGFVLVDSFIQIKEKNKRYLLLKFVNRRNEMVKNLSIKLTQSDSDGVKLGTRQVELLNVDGEPSSAFVVDDKIELYEDCADFTIDVVSATYDNYLYEQRHDEVVTGFVADESDDNKVNVTALKKKMGGKKSSAKVLKAKIPALIGVLAVVIAACIVIVTYIHLNLFKQTQDSFVKSDIEYAFADEKKSDDCDVYVVGYTGLSSSIIIPEKIDDHTVVKVASSAFANNWLIKSVQFEGTITIEANAFNSCNALEEVNFVNVTSIGERAFLGCSNLKSVTATKLEYIGSYAFANCSNLSSVDISNDSKTLKLERDAFSFCSKLATVSINQTIQYPDDLSVFNESVAMTQLSLKNYPENSGDGYPVARLFGYSNASYGSSLSLKTIYIESMNAIPVDFCNSLKVSKVTIDNLSVNSLPNKAFYNCTSLALLNLPNAMESVGDYALYGTQLKSFNFTKVTRIGQSAFAKCSQLTEVLLANNYVLETIGSCAFQECTSLQSITIPASIKIIDAKTFESCSSLTDVNFDRRSKLTTIYSGAFRSCTSLSTIELPSSVTAIYDGAFEKCTNLPNIQLPEKITEIYGKAFAQCTALTEMTIPQSVNAMGVGIFYLCNKLEELTVPSLPTAQDGTSKLVHLFATSLTANASNCVPESLKKVTVTSSNTIGSYAFSDCVFLETVELPNATEIGQYAFANCTKIETIDCSYVQNIGAYAFNNCTSLKNITFSDTLKVINELAFGGCSSLEEITIPNTVTTLANGAFVNCNALKSITLPYLPDGMFGKLFSQYDYTDNYSLGYNVPESLKTVTITKETSISEYAFFYCQYIETVNLFKNTTNIGSYAFSNCRSLKAIELPSSLKRISNYAFDSCIKLTEITLPKSLTDIGEIAFNGCSRLYVVYNNSKLNIQVGDWNNGYVGLNALVVCNSGDDQPIVTESGDYKFLLVDDVWNLIDYDSNATSLTLPASFDYDGKTISQYALPKSLFSNNYKLVDINIPAVITDIGENCFSQCYNMQSITINSDSTMTSIRGYTFNGCNSLQSFDIMSKIETIEWGAFSGCFGLKSLVIPKSVKTIKENAFANCYKLYEITNYSDLNITCGSDDNGGVAYYALAVYKSANEKKVDFFTESNVNFAYYNGTLTIIGYSGDSDTLNLESITYSTKYTTCNIASYAFYNCYALKTVHIGIEINQIGDSAFAYCYNLAEIEISGGIKTIGDEAFIDCSQLTSVKLPSTLTSIGNNAFLYCNSLIVVYNFSQLNLVAGQEENGYVAYYAAMVTDDENVKIDTYYDGNFYFYAIDGDWYLYKTNSYYDLMTLPSWFIYNNTTISSYTIKADVFRMKLSSIVIPVNVTSIQDNAFADGVDKIYYEGTQQQWKKLKAGVKYSSIYYYSDCVHESGYWTYIGDEIVDQTSFTEHVANEATCTEKGLVETVCDYCGEVVDKTYTDKIDHDPDDDGVCKMCGKKVKG